MNRGSTLFLKVVIILIGIGTLALLGYWLPDAASRTAAADPEIAYLKIPFLAYVYGMAVPFFAALYQAFKLLNYIDANLVFSELSIQVLRNIKNCAIIIIFLIALGEVFVVFFMQGDRAHFVALGIYLIFPATVVATCIAVLQKLLQSAVDIKSENDLTV